MILASRQIMQGTYHSLLHIDIFSASLSGIMILTSKLIIQGTYHTLLHIYIYTYSVHH